MMRLGLTQAQEVLQNSEVDPKISYMQTSNNTKIKLANEEDQTSKIKTNRHELLEQMWTAKTFTGNDDEAAFAL